MFDTASQKCLSLDKLFSAAYEGTVSTYLLFLKSIIVAFNMARSLALQIGLLHKFRDSNPTIKAALKTK
jgi:hypothetical protein